MTPPLSPKIASFAALVSDSPLMRCAAHSALISEAGTPQTFSVYVRKKRSKRRRPKRFETQSSSVRLAAAAAREGRGVGGEDAPELDRTQLPNDVARAQRIVEEAAVPVDAREAGAKQELVAHDLVPERVDLAALREEPVPSEVEAVAVAHDGLGQPAHLALGLEDEDGTSSPARR